MWLKTNTDATSVLNGRLPLISTIAPISPTARANASATPERIPGRMFGSTMLRKTRNSLAPSDARGFLRLEVELEQHRLHRAHDERQRLEEQREHDRLPRERDVDAERRLRPVEREQRQAGDDRRQRERQVDDRVDEALAAEVVADEHPGGDRSEDRVDERRRSTAAPSVSFSAATASGAVATDQNSLPAVLPRRPDERRDREEHDHARGTSS